VIIPVFIFLNFMVLCGSVGKMNRAYCTALGRWVLELAPLSSNRTRGASCDERRFAADTSMVHLRPCLHQPFGLFRFELMNFI
jgi:hypothetical protein